MRLLNIGYGNVVVAERVVAVISPDSAPMKRFKDEARKAGRLIDGTQGRRTRSILITDSHHIVLSALQTETVAERLERGAGTASSSPRSSGATPLPPEDEAPEAHESHDLDANADADEADAPDGGDGGDGGDGADHDDPNGPNSDDDAHG